jgi:mevalonate kinase
MKVFLQKKVSDFEVKVSGKWILAGEHSVLRGGRAIVFPLNSRYLKLKYDKTETDFEISLSDQNSSELELIIWSVLERALKKIGIKRTQLKGLLHFDSKIQFGAGMGASATLCVALTHLFSYFGYLKEGEKYEFARDLENLFHGESSGVDVAVTLHQKPLIFSRHEGFEFLENYQKPHLYLSYTGERGVTKDCVDKVKKLFIESAVKAQSIDAKMIESVEVFEKLLRQSKINHSEWIEGLKKSFECFYDWGLVNDSVRHHEAKLLQAGAQACKLTGSGHGGFMLSYWIKPPSNVTLDLIPCFNFD